MNHNRRKNMVKTFIAIFVGLLVLGASLPSQAQNNFVIPRDASARNPSNIRSAPTYVQARVLAAGVSETITLPAGTRLVIFSSTCNFFAKTGASAAVPAADVTDGTASELNPTAWYYSNALTATQDVSVISSTACTVTASAYTGVLQ
jgi:hypothetical protein